MSSTVTYLADITRQLTPFDDVSGFSVFCWVIAVVAGVVAVGVSAPWPRSVMLSSGRAGASRCRWPPSAGDSRPAAST